MSRGMWEAVEAKTGKTGVAKAKRGRKEKERRREMRRERKGEKKGRKS